LLVTSQKVSDSKAAVLFQKDPVVFPAIVPPPGWAQPAAGWAAAVGSDHRAPCPGRCLPCCLPCCLPTMSAPLPAHPACTAACPSAISCPAVMAGCSALAGVVLSHQPPTQGSRTRMKRKKNPNSLKSVLSKQKIDLTSFSNHKHKFGFGWVLCFAWVLLHPI